MKIVFARYLALSSVAILALVLRAPTAFAADEDDSRQRKRQLAKAAIETAAHLATAAGKAAQLFKLHGAPSVGTQIRHLKSKNNGMFRKKKAKKQISSLQDQLDQCRAEQDSPKNLFVQMANHCMLKRSISSSGDSSYLLVSSDMNEETWVFTDRPFRHEETLSTKVFLDNFLETFQTSLPNAAITFVSEVDHIFEGPLVSIFLDGVYSETAVDLNDGTSATTYTYVLEQSEDQRAVIPLDSFFSEEGESIVSFEDCSIFIDSTSTELLCTGEGSDPYSTGSNCCSGLEQVQQKREWGYPWLCVRPDNSEADVSIGMAYGYGNARESEIETRVSNDIDVIKACPATSGVTRIRTYFGKYFNAPDVTVMFADYNLLPGYTPDFPGFAYKETHEKNLMRVYSDDRVQGIAYLNEVYKEYNNGVYLGWESIANGFFNSITRTRKPIVTIQTTAVNYAQYQPLLGKGYDGIMINIYPNFFYNLATDESFPYLGKNGEDAFKEFCHQLGEVSTYYDKDDPTPGEYFYGIGETGFPYQPPYTKDLSKDYFNKIKAFVEGSKNCDFGSYSDLVEKHRRRNKVRHPDSSKHWLGVYAFEALSEPQKGTVDTEHPNNKNYLLEKTFGVVDAFDCK